MFRKKATHFFKFTQKFFHASFWHLFARPWDDNDVETQRFFGRSIAGTARPVSASKHRPAIRRAPFPTQPRRTARPQIIPPNTKTFGAAFPLRLARSVSPARPLRHPNHLRRLPISRPRQRPLRNTPSSIHPLRPEVLPHLQTAPSGTSPTGSIANTAPPPKENPAPPQKTLDDPPNFRYTDDAVSQC